MHTPEQHREKVLADFSRDFRAKYDKGQAEYGTLLPTGGAGFFTDSAIEEAVDQVAYLYSLRDKIYAAIGALHCYFDEGADRDLVVSRALELLGSDKPHPYVR